MIRETVTIALLMSTSAAFGQVCTPDCDPDAVSYQVPGGPLVDSPAAVVASDWFRQGGNPVYCGPGPGRHQALYGPSGTCNPGQTVLRDFTQLAVFGQCPAPATAKDRDGFKPTVDAFLGIPDTNPSKDTAFQREIQQTSILQEGARYRATRPGGAEVVFELMGGVYFPRNGTDRLTKWPDGSLSYDIAENGSVEKYRPDGTLISSTDKDGNVTLYEFDPIRKLEIRRVTNGLVTTTEWDTRFKLPSRIAEPERITIYAYSDDGRLLSVSTQKTADLDGALAFNAPLVGSPSLQTTFAYNAGGRVERMRDGPVLMDLVYDDTVLTEISVRTYTPLAAGWAVLSDRWLRPKPAGPDAGFCGSGWNEPHVPDGVGGVLNLDFKTACRAHDECYGRCGSDKGKCDQQLQVGMLEQCVKNNYAPEPGHKGNIRLEACMRWANTYHTFVDKLGAGPYKAAQDQCLPKCTP